MFCMIVLLTSFMDSSTQNDKKKVPPPEYNKEQRLIGRLLRAMKARELQDGLDPQEGYYLISMEWWAKYKVRMRLDGPDMPEKDLSNQTAMGEIDNNDLLSNGYTSPSAMINVTCTYVTEQIWNLLIGW